MFWICSLHIKLYSDPFHFFWKCFWFLNPLQQSFVLCMGRQVLPGVLLWANTCHAALEIWSHGNAKSINELCHYKWWDTGPMTSSFGFTKALTGEGSCRNLIFVLLIWYKHKQHWDTTWQKIILEIYVTNTGITQKTSGL